MRRTTKAEQAALEAAFLSQQIKRTFLTSNNTAKEHWQGWYGDGEYLFDDAGNHYHQAEIRAIFYTRQQVRELQRRIEEYEPKKEGREQLALPGVFGQEWKKANR
jgi:hypothetical protein